MKLKCTVLINHTHTKKLVQGVGTSPSRYKFVISIKKHTLIIVHEFRPTLRMVSYTNYESKVKPIFNTPTFVIVLYIPAFQKKETTSLLVMKTTWFMSHSENLPGRTLVECTRNMSMNWPI